MTALNKQALREAAERAASDSWGYDRDEFNDAITPDVALALLDELEAAENRIAEPVSVPDLKPVGFLFVSDDGAVAYSPAGLPMKGFNLICPIYGDVNACRAAMLQAEPVSNSDELPLDYLQGHKDGLEWAAQLAEANHPQTGDWLYDDPIELARAIRKGPDMPTSQAGNSPVTPDCWCRTCRPVTMNDMRFVVCPECGNKRCPRANDHRNACTGSNEPDQEGSAYPTAPKQEVKSAFEHGMQRYAGAMQKLSEGDK